VKDSTSLIRSSDSFAEINGKPVNTINPPVYNGSTVLFECYEDFLRACAGRYEGVCYGTDRLPTQRAFEEAVRKLEGGYLTRAFQSGISAIINTFLAYSKSGDHILICDNVYGPTTRFCKEILSRYNIEVSPVPPSAGEDIAEFIRPETRLIFLESPGSNTFEIQDIPAIVSVAREKGIVTVLDNTWATPLYFRPLDLGVDISIQSVTKYISGHSDLLLGTATVNEKHSKILERFYRVMELYASPDDCYLALRGLRTLSVRLKQHEKSALEIARWLQSVEIVDEVVHPALPCHPEHHLWKRDFSGSSGLFAFTFKREYPVEKMAAFIDALEFFAIGFSWGGYKSLITAGQYRRSMASRYSGKTLVRLNIGLEDAGDLREDLDKAMKLLK
jgi:cystathionine beta-lyase